MQKKKAEHAGGIVDSTVELGVAATKFAMDQLETALYAVGSPGKAIDRIKKSIDNFADAMNASVETETGASKEKTEKACGGTRAEAAQKVETEEAEGAAEETLAFTGRKT